MKRKHLHRTPTVFQWFCTIFVIISLLFCIALVPLFLYMQNVFTNLTLEKSRKQLLTGTSEVESVAAGVLNMSNLLMNDSRFIALRYMEPDYSALPANIRLQLKNTFNNMLLSMDLVNHAALELSENVAIGKNNVFFEGLTNYYPEFFSVNDLEHGDWVQLLSQNKSCFLPACTAKVNNVEYTALIFSTKWSNSSYLYACMKISDVKKLLIEEALLDDCYVTITRSDKTLIYSDLPDSESDYQTLSEQITTGNLEISIHMPDAIFYQKMQPLYFFLTVYACICIVMLIVIILMGTRISSKPFTDIIQILEHSRNIPLETPTDTVQFRPTANLRSGFDYISNSILNADQHLEQYQNTIQTQQKILQARFLEKAINGQLLNPKEIHQFHSYFPDFPDKYCLLLIRLDTYTDDSSALYSDPLLILQSFLQSELPGAYQQQYSDSELLLLVSEEDFGNYRTTLDFVVDNINREEPSYMIRCVASRIYEHLENLPAAYRQIREMEGLSFSSSRTHVCTVADCMEMPGLSFSLTELMTLYTAIAYGNRDMALKLLHTYSEELERVQNASLNKTVYGMIQTILTGIKPEYPVLLIDEHIPAYHATAVRAVDTRTAGIHTTETSTSASHQENTLYMQLSQVVIRFCDKIQNNNKPDMDPFVQELISYIDANYMDCDLCLTTLETHFKCSSSTIRKAFKNATNTTVSSYIEQKRMHRANELLAQKQKTIAEIALECGFTNPNSFYKAYRRVYGHAPTVQMMDGPP